jgi:hypothetical protein
LEDAHYLDRADSEGEPRRPESSNAAVGVRVAVTRLIGSVIGLDTPAIGASGPY